MSVTEKITETRYSYSFFVWPSETWGFRRALFDLFRVLNAARVEMVLTEREFEHFRSELNHDGFTLREIERWPHEKPNPVV